MVCKKNIAVFLVIFVANWTSGQTPENRQIQEVTQRYLNLTFGEQRDLDQILPLLADDFFFVDPTSDALGAESQSAKGVVGAKNFVAHERNWGLDTVSFDSDKEVVIGNSVLHLGHIGWTAKGSPPVNGIPFATLLQVRDGKLVERRDYGDYDLFIPNMEQKSQGTENTASEYVEAYRTGSADTLADFLSDDSMLSTQSTLNADSTSHKQGRKAILQFVKDKFETTKELELEFELAFCSGRHAFYTGTSNYLSGQELLQADHWMVITIDDGVVIEHREWTNLN